MTAMDLHGSTSSSLIFVHYIFHFGPRRQKKKSVFLSGQKLGPIYIVFLKGLAEFWSFSLFVSLAHSDH